MVRLPRGGHRIQGCGAIFARYGGLPSDRWRTARPPRLSCRPKKTWQPKHPRGMAIPFRYVTENRVCQQVANPPASTPSATPNDKLNIAPADRPNNPHPRSVTGGRRTDGPELSVGTTPSPSWSRCKPNSLRDSVTAEALQAVVGLDFDAFTAIVPPRGYGRD
jgi:hypothetical protein